jgi:CIC family chloride channel protein
MARTNRGWTEDVKPCDFVVTAVSRRTLMLLFVAAGVASGAAAVLFHEWIVITRELMLDRALSTTGWRRAVLVVLIPAATAGAIGWIVQRFAPSVLGANLARVRRAYGEDVRHLDVRTIVWTFLLTPLSLGSGAPLGPEGPTVVVTSGLSVRLAQLLRFPRKVIRGMVPVGTAAGIAAIFRTPITGVVFALEELFGTSSRSILGGTLIAAVAAAVVQHMAATGNVRILPASAATWTSAWEMVGFALLGVCAGIVSGAVLRVATVARERLRLRFPSAPLRFAIAGAAVGLIGLLSPAVLGVGYETTSSLVRGGGSLMFGAEVFGAKTLAFTVAASAGLLGGTFAPSLFIGASLGAVVGHAARLVAPWHIDTGAYALVGMGAFFAGTLRAPIAAVLIVVELTNDYGLVLPLMLGVALSNTISHAVAPMTLEEDQLAHEGVAHDMEPGDPFARLVVSEAMTREVISFRSDATIAEVLEGTREVRHSTYPVIDDDRRLVGLLTGEAVGRGVREGRLGDPVAEVMKPPVITARERERVSQLLERMAAANVDRCAVVDERGRLAGFISPSDLVRARYVQQQRLADETLR